MSSSDSPSTAPDTANAWPSIKASSEESIKEAAALLHEGHLVAFPTETVYGLGADAQQEHAVAKIFAAKGRPHFNPLIIHLAAPEQARDYVQWNDTAALLAAAFWPGPLTLILPQKPNNGIAPLATAGLDTMAVRVPSHPVAQALLQAAALPVAAPSANASGFLSPTSPAHVAESLKGNVDLILAGGRSKVGLESTVVDLSHGKPAILRPGFVTPEGLERMLGEKIGFAAPINPEKPQSPGQLSSHYAPHCPVRLGATDLQDGEALLAFGDDSALIGKGPRLNLSEKGDLIEAAANLFRALHDLDKMAPQRIAVMPIPKTGLGIAINDRLARAATPRQDV